MRVKYLLITLFLFIVFIISCNEYAVAPPDLTPTPADDANSIAAKEEMHKDLLAEETKRQWMGYAQKLFLPLVLILVAGLVLIGINQRVWGGSLTVGGVGGLLAITTLAHASRLVAAVGIGVLATGSMYILYILYTYRKAIIEVVLGNEAFKKIESANRGVLDNFKDSQKAIQSPETEKLVDNIRDNKENKNE